MATRKLKKKHSDKHDGLVNGATLDICTRNPTRKTIYGFDG